MTHVRIFIWETFGKFYIFVKEFVTRRKCGALGAVSVGQSEQEVLTKFPRINSGV